MAKTEAPTPPLWTGDDIARLAEALDTTAQKLSETERLLADALTRLDTLSGTVALLDPTKAALPVELSKHINLGQIYNTLIGNTYQAMIMMRPQLLTDSKYRKQTIAQYLDVADVMLEVICERHSVDLKTKTK